MDDLLAILSAFSVFSPPVLIGIAWVRFSIPEAKSQPKWRRMLGGANLLAVSVLLSVWVLKLLGYRCNADADVLVLCHSMEVLRRVNCSPGCVFSRTHFSWRLAHQNADVYFGSWLSSSMSSLLI